MLGLTRWNSVDDFFTLRRQLESVFDQFWNELPDRTAAGHSPSFQVTTTDDGWRIDVPLPGIDPRNVNLDAAGHTVTIRAEQPASSNASAVRRCRTVSALFLSVDAQTPRESLTIRVLPGLLIRFGRRAHL